MSVSVQEALPPWDDPAVRALLSGSDVPAELTRLLDVAKFQVDFQLKMAERLDAKARGLLGVTAVFAGAAQAFSLRADVLAQLSTTSRWGLGVAAAVTALLLGTACVLTASAVVLRQDSEVDPGQLLGQINNALQNDQRVTVMMVYQHLDLAAARKAANDTRATRMVTAERACFATLVIATLQFVVAVLTLL